VAVVVGVTPLEIEGRRSQPIREHTKRQSVKYTFRECFMGIRRFLAILFIIL
jgi:hypothetical protein